MSALCFPGRFSSPRGAEHNLRRRATGLAAKVLATALLLVCLSGTCQAMDQPPAAAPQQRAWPLNHLVADMRSTGSFPSPDLAEVASLLNSLTDDQISLLAQYYCLTRAKTEQDARLFAIELSETQEALAQAKAECADLLTQQQVQIEQTYADLAPLNASCQTLCQVAYASIPGWCAFNRYAVPVWYYNGGCYVGPVFSAVYCGTYAAPLYRIFYDLGSRDNYWNSRAYLHNNLTRITIVAHTTRRTPGGLSAPGPRTTHVATGHAAAAIAKPRSQTVGKNRSLPPAVRHDTALSTKHPSATRSQPRPAGRPAQPMSVARVQPHVQPSRAVAAQPRQQQPRRTAALQRVARAQPRSQHVAQAHVTFAPSRRK